MKSLAKSIRPFIGAKNYETSRGFYRDFGFQEVELSHDMCVYKLDGNVAFYLQKYFVKDWVENTMLFLEVEHTEAFREEAQPTRKLMEDLKANRRRQLPLLVI